MNETNPEILLHPVRLRIVLALGSEHLTTAAISERMPDVAHATLYRQVAILADAGLLEVVAERRVRGGVERTYAVVADMARLVPADREQLRAEDLQRGLVIFAGSLIEAFGRYLDHPDADPAEDAVGYRQAALWLDADERIELVGRLRSAIGPSLQNAPSQDRQRVLLSTILIPDLAASPTDGSSASDMDSRDE